MLRTALRELIVCGSTWACIAPEIKRSKFKVTGLRSLLPASVYMSMMSPSRGVQILLSMMQEGRHCRCPDVVYVVVFADVEYVKKTWRNIVDTRKSYQRTDQKKKKSGSAASSSSTSLMEKWSLAEATAFLDRYNEPPRYL